MNDRNRQDDKQEEVTQDSDVIASEEKQSQEENLNQQDEEVDAVGEELQKLQETAVQLENQLKRSLADYQNLQRRVQEEKVHWIATANKDLLLKLFPILDTLMLAYKHVQDKGLELSIHQFLQVLQTEGVTKIKTVDEEFDPQYMEAVTTQEVKGKAGKVIEEIRPGYMYHDSVIRVAQVIVGA